MTNPIFDKIKSDLSANDIVLYMKGTPEMPECGFSGFVVQALKHHNVAYKGVDVMQDEDIRQGIKDFSNWPTIPQLYIKGEFVGGCDIVKEMHASGELEEMVKPFRHKAAI